MGADRARQQRTRNEQPDRRAEAPYELRVHGLVHRPASFSYSELAERATVDRFGIGAVQLRDLFAEVRLDTSADLLVVADDQGKFTLLSIREALRVPSTSLTLGPSTGPLPRAAGFPVRLTVPDRGETGPAWPVWSIGATTFRAFVQ